MVLSRDELKKVFEDTRNFFHEEPLLEEAITYSNTHTRIYAADFYEEVERNKQGIIRVIRGRTLESALWFKAIFPEKKIAVLNFASSTTPGGGVWWGSRAQEESICRSSTLYPSISTDEMKKGYYRKNSDNYSFTATDACIYSPRIIVCKDDGDYIPKRLSPEEFIEVDVITCAAPNLKHNDLDPYELFEIHWRRAENIMRVSAFNDVDILISGAFGCGAFKNSPEIVASAWHKALEDYRMKFDYVVFAVYSRSHELENFRTFKDEFKSV